MTAEIIKVAVCLQESRCTTRSAIVNLAVERNSSSYLAFPGAWTRAQCNRTQSILLPRTPDLLFSPIL